MTWHLTDSVDEFLAGAGDFLRARPAEHTVLLTVTETVRQRGGPAVFGWCGAGAFVRTPPREALLSEMPPAAAAALAASLAGTDLPGVAAPGAVTEAFAAEWQRLTGVTGKVTGGQRLYRLEQLTPPDPAAPGAARIAGASDRDLLIDWMTAFQRELGEGPRGAAEFVDDKLSHDGIMLWEHAGQPVSMAGTSRPAAGMARVQAVYTPREHRARGYAGATTAAVTRAALDAGVTDVVLFADLDNPTSNALYQRLGYVPISDRRTVEFPS